MSIVAYFAPFVEMTLFRCSLTVIKSAVGDDKLPLDVNLAPPTIHIERFVSIFVADLWPARYGYMLFFCEQVLILD